MTAPSVSAARTGFERIAGAVQARPRLSLALSWAIPLALTILAAVLRFTNLAHPNALVFDETYYVKDAWSLWVLGYEGGWSEEASAAFADGDTSGLGDQGSFVVHPPLGKWLIALGMGVFGQGSSFGWRFSVALLGTASIPLLYAITRKLSHSRLWAAVAAGLLAIDGTAIVLSRTALLDTILGFFLLLGIWFLILDATSNRNMPVMASNPPALSARDERANRWGPLLWRRPWLVAAGATLGAAAAVKWSGFYALAGFGIYLVVTDALSRRRAGVAYWPQAALLKQGPVTFLLLVPAAVLVYLASWTGWFLTAGGYDRQSAQNPLLALWNYHQAIYHFHSGLSSAHTYESPAWQWPLLLRPTAFWVGGSDGQCGAEHCIAVISAVSNPLIWYGGVLAALWLTLVLIWRTIVRPIGNRNARIRLLSLHPVLQTAPRGIVLATPLLGLAVTYLPWLLIPERTIFQFYTVVMVPYMVICLIYLLRAIAGTNSGTLYRRASGQYSVAVILAIITLLSAFFLPLWLGLDIPYDLWRVHNWLPSWI